MLNLSRSKIRDKMDLSSAKTLVEVEKKEAQKVVLKLLGIFSFSFLVAMFLPWTQNIRGMGVVNTLRPEQRPQTIHSIIDGRIEEWMVREGDYVEQGDTILKISEIKDAYFDPELLQRTEEQIKAKQSSVESYKGKIQALDDQIEALRRTLDLKLRQSRNRLTQAKLQLQSDSIDFQAIVINTEIAKQQFERMERLEKQGLKSLTDVENRKRIFQKAMSEKIAAENRMLGTQNEVLNAEMEIVSIEAQFRNAIAKAESDKYSAMSNMFDAETSVAKLRNQYSNYSVRLGMYFITAPQNGYITKAIRIGIGENIKSGEQIVSIVPSDYELAVEMFIRPIDLPLIKLGQRVRIQFDGWPAIIFSGWPGTSFGTFGGRVFAIDNFISDNGLYRIIVAPDYDDYPWPEELRAGAGANSILLLNDVPVWYEMWRQFNGFPPDYYSGGKSRKGKMDNK
jgi:multidrug resistance efflux pump